MSVYFLEVLLYSNTYVRYGQVVFLCSCKQGWGLKWGTPLRLVYHNFLDYYKPRNYITLENVVVQCV